MKTATRARLFWILIIAGAGLAAAAYEAGGKQETSSANRARRAPVASALVQQRPARPALLQELEALQVGRAQTPAAELFGAKSWYVAPPPAPPPPPVQAAPVQPSAPPLPFTFMGKLVEAERLTVFLVKQERVYMASEGDVIDDTYKLEKIEPGRLTLLYLPLKTVHTLVVGESQ
ncbi:secretion system X translation initiation factor [Massilia glaciei]|uniref:Secretion system X translation initiation factor n=1 Tax=Massilia glaciei TaxID=1524097 RepID=A0A2U2HC28_9BURK|nr:secretion system X translation initiation factor [Massilia glaciei]PWF40453.1 secretion system X translation initiation factor [Massilia glaciei]